MKTCLPDDRYMMMVDRDVIAILQDGYRRFRGRSYRAQSDRFRLLAEGQSPRAMIVACADSRIDPAMIFDAEPGELFVVRNVANLIPPFSKDDVFEGMSAAVEFAVEFLKVDAIIVMGHADCGGIKACLAREQGNTVGKFIDPWVALADIARGRVLSKLPPGSSEQQMLQCLEQESVRLSLENLQTFPFVEQSVEQGLQLFGAWFSIWSGELHWLDRDEDLFRPI